MRFTKIFVDVYEDNTIAYFTRYCSKCGYVHRVHLGTKDSTVKRIAGIPISTCPKCKTVGMKVESEIKRDAIIRDVMVALGLHNTNFARLTMTDEFKEAYQKQLRNRRRYRRKMFANGATNPKFWEIQLNRQLKDILVRNGLAPIGPFRAGGAWLVKTSKLDTIMKVLGRTRGEVAGYGHLLFSDGRFRVKDAVRVTYSSKFEERSGTDGEGVIPAHMLKGFKLKSGFAPKQVQVRIFINNEDGTMAIAKGTLRVVNKAKHIIVGPNMVKTGKDGMVEGKSYRAKMIIVGVDRPRTGRPGWELISWLKNTPAVNAALDKLVRDRVEELANTLLNGDRKSIIDRYGDPEKEEWEQPLIVQMARSNLPMNSKIVLTELSQLFFDACVDIVMGSGIEARLRMAKVDKRIDESELTEYAIRMPFIAGKHAVIRCRADGMTIPKYMNKWSNMDTDGDKLHILDRELGKLLYDAMEEIPAIDLPDNGWEIKKDSTPANHYSLVDGFGYQLDIPDIGIGCSDGVLGLAVGDLDVAHSSFCCSEIGAQLVKKRLFDKDGNLVRGDMLLEEMKASVTDDQDKRAALNYCREWFRAISEIRGERANIGYYQFASVLSKQYNARGKLNKFSNDWTPFNPEKNPGILNWRFYRNIEIMLSIHDKYDLYEKVTRESYGDTNPLTKDENRAIADIVNFDATGYKFIRKCERDGMHKEYVSSLRSAHREALLERAALLTMDQIRLIAIKCLHTKRPRMMEMVMKHHKLSIADVFGYDVECEHEQMELGL